MLRSINIHGARLAVFHYFGLFACYLHSQVEVGAGGVTSFHYIGFGIECGVSLDLGVQRDRLACKLQFKVGGAAHTGCRMLAFVYLFPYGMLVFKKKECWGLRLTLNSQNYKQNTYRGGTEAQRSKAATKMTSRDCQNCHKCQN